MNLTPLSYGRVRLVAGPDGAEGSVNDPPGRADVFRFVRPRNRHAAARLGPPRAASATCTWSRDLQPSTATLSTGDALLYAERGRGPEQPVSDLPQM